MRFSNSPETHRRDLEKQPDGYVTLSKWVSVNFHFSSANYGYYCSLITYMYFLRVTVADRRGEIRVGYCFPTQAELEWGTGRLARIGTSGALGTS